MLPTTPLPPFKLTYTRRQYHRQKTFCWARITLADGNQIDLGDPWPAVHWPSAIITPLAEAAAARYASSATHQAGDLDTASAFQKLAEAANARAIRAQQNLLEKQAQRFRSIKRTVT